MPSAFHHPSQMLLCLVPGMACAFPAIWLQIVEVVPVDLQPNVNLPHTPCLVHTNTFGSGLNLPAVLSYCCFGATMWALQNLLVLQATCTFEESQRDYPPATIHWTIPLGCDKDCLKGCWPFHLDIV